LVRGFVVSCSTPLLRQTPNAKRKIPTQEQGEAIANFSKRSFTCETVNCLLMWRM